MKVQSLLFIVLCFVVNATTAQTNETLNIRITQLEELQRKVTAECLRNPNSSDVQVQINNTTLTCGHLIVLTNRLEQQLDRDITELEESCELRPPSSAETLARQTAQIARASACPVESRDTDCRSTYACAALTMANPLTALIGGAQRLSGDRRSCLARGAGSAPGCLQNIVKGIFDSMWGLLSLVWDVGSAAVRSFVEWTRIIGRQERSSSERLMAAQNAGPGFITRFIQNPAATMSTVMNQVYEGIKQAAMQSYGCEAWAEKPYVSDCVRPMQSWDCATCQQKLQLMCGVAGFAIGEIGTGILTGGTGAVVAAALKGVKAGAVASRFSTLALNVIEDITRPSPALSRATGAVLDATRVVLTPAQREVIRVWTAIKNSSVTSGIASAVRAVDQSIIGQATRFTLRPAAFYLELLDRGTRFGYRTVDSAIASAVGRVSGAGESAVQADRIADAARATDVVADTVDMLEDAGEVLENFANARPQGMEELSRSVPDYARAHSTLSSSQMDELVGAAESNVARRMVDGSDEMRIADEVFAPAPTQLRTPDIRP